jgi:hypothetical protein
MSGGFTLLPEMSSGQSAGLSLSTGGTLVQGGTGASNTKGSWVQLVASSSFDATWMYIRFATDGSVSSNINNMLFDVGVGSAGSEVIVIPNVHFNTFPGDNGEGYIFPVSIPAGSRIAARAQADFTSANSGYVALQLFEGGFTQLEAAGADDIGTNTANSNLTSITSGTSGVKGSYTQLVASTARDYAGLVVVMNDTVNNATGGVESLDIAAGGAGSEIVIIPDVWVRNKSQFTKMNIWVPYLTPITAGTRISARASSSGVSGAGFNAAVYGIYT